MGRLSCVPPSLPWPLPPPPLTSAPTLLSVMDMDLSFPMLSTSPTMDLLLSMLQSTMLSMLPSTMPSMLPSTMPSMPQLATMPLSTMPSMPLPPTTPPRPLPTTPLPLPP